MKEGLVVGMSKIVDPSRGCSNGGGGGHGGSRGECGGRSMTLSEQGTNLSLDGSVVRSGDVHPHSHRHGRRTRHPCFGKKIKSGTKG